MHFNLTDLRLFVAVAELSSLTRAAERCHLSLPAVSHRIRVIEEQARCQLLDRQPRGVGLTPAGEAFARHARTMLIEVDALHTTLNDFAEGQEGNLTILANTTAVTEFMPAVLARFLAEHSQLSVTLKEQANYEIARAVREGRADLGVVAGDLDLSGLWSRHFATDRLVLIVPGQHALAKRRSAGFSEVVTHPLVGLYAHSTLQTFLAGRVEAMGWPQIRLRVQVNSFEALSLMVEAGVGLAVVPESAAHRYGARMRISAISLTDAWAVRERYVILRDGERASQSLRELVAAICDHRTAGSPTPDGVSLQRVGSRRSAFAN